MNVVVVVVVVVISGSSEKRNGTACDKKNYANKLKTKKSMTMKKRAKNPRIMDPLFFYKRESSLSNYMWRQKRRQYQPDRLFEIGSSWISPNSGRTVEILPDS